MARKRFIRGGRSVRQTMWIGLDATTTALAAANSATLILALNAGGLALRPFTIVRTRGSMLIRSDQTAVSEVQQVALSAAVVSDQASAIGITAVPTGFTDAGSDLFFLYEQQINDLVVTSAVGSLIYTSINYDSKAMRKVNDDQDVIFTLENSGIGQGSVTRHAGRMLIKLH